MPEEADPRVDAYIRALPEWQQEICRQVRHLVHAADPDVAETIKRSSQPYFVVDGNICALLAAKDYVNVSLYDGVVPDPDRNDLIRTGSGGWHIASGRGSWNSMCGIAMVAAFGQRTGFSTFPPETPLCPECRAVAQLGRAPRSRRVRRERKRSGTSETPENILTLGKRQEGSFPKVPQSVRRTLPLHSANDKWTRP